MDIREYKYDKEKFQEQALIALEKKNEADKRLTNIEHSMMGR